MSPHDVRKPEIWDRAWNYDGANSVIAITYGLGDTSGMSQVDLGKAVEEKHPDWCKQSKTKAINTTWAFWHEVKVGDIIITRRGTKRIAGVGTVTKEAFYDEVEGAERVGGATNDPYSDFIGVAWHDTPRDVKVNGKQFSQQTIREIDEVRYRELMAGNKSEPDVSRYEIDEDKYDDLMAGRGPELDITEGSMDFVMEKYLEEFIVSNFGRIFDRQLELYRDPDGNVVGQQFPTGIGNIDILAVENASNALVVIELKRGRGSDKVAGQMLRYMGWINANLCSEGQKVKGLIICRESDPKLLCALRMTPDIDLMYYQVDFNLMREEEQLKTN